MNAAQRKRLRTALQAMPSELKRPSAAPPAEADQEEMDVWITRYLVIPGDDLLISEEERRLLLSRLRDVKRRTRRRAGGLLSGHIEMKTEDWALLDKAVEQFGGDANRGMALAKIIRAFMAKPGRKCAHDRDDRVSALSAGRAALQGDLLNNAALQAVRRTHNF